MATPLIRGSVTTGNSSTTSFTVNKPTGVVADDLLLSFQCSGNGIGTITSGWSSLRTITDGGFDSRIASKTAGGSEGGSYSFAQGGGFPGIAMIIALSGVGDDAPVTALANGVGSGATVTTPSVVAVGEDDFEVRFAWADIDGSFDAPAGFLERANVSDFGVSATCATRVLTSSGATGTANFTASPSPASRYGYTISVSGKPDASGRRVFVATSAAVHRAANW